MQKAILNRGDAVAWFLEGKEVSADYLNANELQLTSIAQVKTYQPDVVFVPGNIVPAFISGLKVAVFHGFNAGKINRRGFEDHFNIRGCFDLYCTQGPNTTTRFLALADKYQHFSVTETGWPALDPLFDGNESFQRKNKPTDKPVVLFCSTFSRQLSAAPKLFETIKRLSQTGDWQWLVQLHPKMPNAIVEQYKSLESEHLTYIETDNVLPLLEQADVMVCDTSSILMMFLMLEKPVVTFNNISPKDHLINITDPAKLADSIAYALKGSAIHKANISRFIQNTHPYRDGKSSERILLACDDLLAGNNKPKKKKPLNMMRRLKMRRKLSYWRA